MESRRIYLGVKLSEKFAKSADYQARGFQMTVRPPDLTPCTTVSPLSRLQVICDSGYVYQRPVANGRSFSVVRLPCVKSNDNQKAKEESCPCQHSARIEKISSMIYESPESSRMRRLKQLTSSAPEVRIFATLPRLINEEQRYRYL